MERFSIFIYRHSFHVRTRSISDFYFIKKFTNNYASFHRVFDYFQKKMVSKVKDVYAVVYEKSSTIGFHINCFDDFIKYLNDNKVPGEVIKFYKKAESYIPAMHNLTIRDGFQLRDYQDVIIDFLISRIYKNYLLTEIIKCLPIQMGKGKTLLSLYAMYLKGHRCGIIATARDIETWTKEIKGKNDKPGLFVDVEKDFIIIQGKVALTKIIAEAKNGTFNKSITLISIRTMGDYLKEFEETNNSTYGCNPNELYQLLQINTIYVDEAHENMHFHFRHAINCYFNEIVYLSATITSNDYHTNRLYKIIYPVLTRYTGLEISKYTHVVAIGYNFNDPLKVKCEGSRGYSHDLFEQFIMKDKNLLYNYLNMIFSITKRVFLDKYMEGQKLIIFMSKVEMCSLMAEFIRQNITEVTCADYTGDHAAEVLHSYDIIVTTPGSAGTGKDIDGLAVVINSVPVAKFERNSQMLGRLREIHNKFPGVEPYYYYLIASNLNKHIKFHNKMMDTFKKWAKSIKIADSDYCI